MIYYVYRNYMNPLNKINIQWSPKFAYAIGLLATDGNLSSDGRHINLTSKDKEMIDNFKKCLGIQNKVGKKARGGESIRRYYTIQIGDVSFYRFLVSIGITQAKSKTISTIDIPSAYLYDFLRGEFDGDGTFYSYWDHRWRSSFMWYMEFISASNSHVMWIRGELEKFLGIRGHITTSVHGSVFQLKYGKKESVRLISAMFYDKNVVCLSRKRKKIERALSVESIKI